MSTPPPRTVDAAPLITALGERHARRVQDLDLELAKADVIVARAEAERDEAINTSARLSAQLTDVRAELVTLRAQVDALTPNPDTTAMRAQEHAAT